MNLYTNTKSYTTEISNFYQLPSTFHNVSQRGASQILKSRSNLDDVLNFSILTVVPQPFKQPAPCQELSGLNPTLSWNWKLSFPVDESSDSDISSMRSLSDVQGGAASGLRRI
jgi:hypothetical protein